jgi:hypothetical protein
MSITQTLGKCSDVLKMLMENNFEETKDKSSLDNECLDKTERSGEEDEDSIKKKKKLLALLEERLQFILKCMIKLALAKTSK